MLVCACISQFSLVSIPPNVVNVDAILTKLWRVDLERKVKKFRCSGIEGTWLPLELSEQLKPGHANSSRLL